MFDYNLELANDWRNTFSSFVEKKYTKIVTSINSSQLQSKNWMVEEMSNCNLQPIKIALLAGWYAPFTINMLFEKFKSLEFVENFEMDPDVKPITYKFNKRFKEAEKYRCQIRNIMFDSINSNKGPFDLVINTSCEHMFPMKRFRELNPRFNGYYVLQSSDDTKHDDHINCVSSTDELANQANIVHILYSGSKKLENGMTRFMVIGK